jgi:sodium/proline symporter
VASAIIIVYTFLGGFNAVCWTDFFQGMLMLIALMVAPIVTVCLMGIEGYVEPADVLPANYYSVLSSGVLDKASIITIISGLGWGLGYFGMPHILVRYISIKSEKEMKRSQVVGCAWTTVILIMASVVGVVGRKYFGGGLSDSSHVFISMVREVFPALISGILLSAILAASMSTADSQLLASSSAFSSDVYKPIFRKNASDREMLWAGRIVVIIISVVALFIALNPNCNSIMDLVSNAWGAFGSAFGPVVLLSLYWKRLNYQGTLAGIISGFVVDLAWFKWLSESTGLYEIIPGFAAGLIVCIVVSLLTKAPSDEVIKTYEDAKAATE